VLCVYIGNRTEVTHLFSVEQYAKKMLTEGAWGGGIELICFSRIYCVNVHVYRVNCRVICTVTNPHCDPPLSPQMCTSGHGFRRISVFNVHGAKHTVSLVLWDGNHYDFLLLREIGNLTY